MFRTPAFFLIFSFLMTLIGFARSFAVENLDLFTAADPAVTSDISLDDISTVAAKSAAPFSDPDSIFASDPASTEGNLFADNIKGTDDDLCDPANIPIASGIGRRLRLREELYVESEKGNTCAAPPEKSGEGTSDTFLQELPLVIFPPDLSLGENRDVCPEQDYDKHKIPVCSSGYQVDEILIPGTTSMFSLNHATPYRPYGCPPPEELWCCITIGVSGSNPNYMKYDPQIQELRWRFFEIVGYSCVKARDPSTEFLESP